SIRGRAPPPAFAAPAPPAPVWSAPAAPAPAPAREKAASPKPAAPASTGSRSRAAAAWAAALIGAAASLGVWALRRAPADIVLELENADAMALQSSKGDLLVGEGKELVEMSRSGKSVGRRPLDAPVVSLRWDQGSLWSTDGQKARITESSDSGRTTVFGLNHVPARLFAKDLSLWTVDKDGAVLHQFQISRSILGALLQPIDSFDLNGLAAEVFTFDDAGTLWLADRSSRRLYRLRLDGNSFKRVDSAPLSPFVGPQGELRSLTIDDGAIWILSKAADGGRAELRRIALSRFDWKT
ncbi:MAG: hypothetical protein ACHQ49_17460, partial [Elusimicrobiota bacterium]